MIKLPTIRKARIRHRSFVASLVVFFSLFFDIIFLLIYSSIYFKLLLHNIFFGEKLTRCRDL